MAGNSIWCRTSWRSSIQSCSRSSDGQHGVSSQYCRSVLKIESTTDTFQQGAVCHSSPSTSLDPSHSEDCLFLNIYAPTNATAAHPVFVFFQGGGFNSLSAPNLNGSSLIQAGDHDLVVVTFNYRVGPYGFLASKEVQSNGDLNVGLLDQRKVLQWIQKYIRLVSSHLRKENM
jgi:carboxylesterase type B